MIRNKKDWRGVLFIMTIAAIQMSLFFFVSNLWIIIPLVIFKYVPGRHKCRRLVEVEPLG